MLDLSSMKTGFFKNSLAWIFIVIFLSLKVAGLHAFAHDHDSIEHCEVCDLVSTNNFSPLINDITENYIGSILAFCIQAKTIKQYNFVYSATVNVASLFSRPPPFLI